MSLRTCRVVLQDRGVAAGEMPAYNDKAGYRTLVRLTRSRSNRSTLVITSFMMYRWHHTHRVLSHVALKPLVKKQLSAWRSITARLVLLRKLVSEFGLEGGSGLAADAIMTFIQVSGGKTNVGLPVDTWPAVRTVDYRCFPLEQHRRCIPRKLEIQKQVTGYPFLLSLV